MGAKKVWIVGARETCDIVVDQPTVSGEHCRLEFDEGRVFIEDLQSTNGTFVNGERIFKRKQIHPDALVTLGKSVTMPMPSQLTAPAPAPKRSPTPTPAPPVDAPFEDEPGFPLHLLIGSGVAAAVLLLLVVIAIIFWGGGADTQTPNANDPATSASSDNENHNTAAAPKAKSSPSPSPSEAVKNQAVVDHPEDAIHVIAVANADQSQVFRIGTGVAVGPHTIVTSSTVHMVQELLSKKYPQVILLGKPALTIEEFTPHPTYVASFQEAEEAKGKFDQIYSQVETTDLSELPDELAQALEEAYRHYMVIAEKPSHYDVAVIRVTESIPFWLPIANSAALMPRERLTLLGHGYDRLAPYYAADSPLPISDAIIRVQNSSGVAGDTKNARLVVAKFDAPDQTKLHLDTNWNGSPLLNSQGELVGIYSRATPEIKLGAPPTGETFDATVLVDVLPFVRQFTNN
ncbi:FHA domain-containing protein [Bremerella cremea]|uniref:FHA domain-containing protein n=1 Tax=Bremerella cremea TaxID=1031537 RepID=A0A368KXT7_9BACT|nr:FHA domain-containing protein [Bremerella cremea]RCS54495.1 FHA domain-containing protein [Bremerella cremea]